MSSRFHNGKQRVKSTRDGFSLIEVIVSLAIFSMIMVIITGALLSIIAANRKAQSLQSVMGNLNFAVESMMRDMRTGTLYHCGENETISNVSIPRNCPSGGDWFAFEASGGDRSTDSDQVVYRYDETNKSIERSTQGGAADTFFLITSPEVIIDKLTFYTLGALSNDNLQPKTIIIIAGNAGIARGTKTKFNIQTMVSQRVLD